MKRTISRLFLASFVAWVAVGCSPPPVSDPPVNEPSTPTNVPVSNVAHPDRVFQLIDLEKTRAKIAGKDFNLWIMNDAGKRQEGMMFVKDNEYLDNEGMVFVFKDIEAISDGRGFWMHNTLSALDIIYIDKNKKVINVGKGVPQTDTSVKADADFQYVVELKQGTAAKLGLKKGDAITFEKSLVGLD